MNSRRVCPIKLLVDITCLTGPLSGIGRYTLEILLQMAQCPEQVELRGFDDLRHYEPEALRCLLSAVNEPVALSPAASTTIEQRAWPLAKKVIKRIPGARQLRVNLHNKRIARASAQSQGGIYWQPNFILGKTTGPSMVSVYDLSHVRFPHFHPPERLRWLQQGLASTLDRADHVMTVSHFSKSEIVDAYGISPQKISVVYPGVGGSFHHRHSFEELAAVQSKYNLPPQYLLSLGTLEPRKNLKGLIQAYARLSPALRKRYPLVLAGGAGWNHSETDNLIAQLESRGELIKLGFVPQALIPALYQNASAFAYVSLYEGFGMPVAEAMASGVPVMTSNCASMPEVAQGSALLVEPRSVESITQGLDKLLGDLNGVSRPSDAGRNVSHNYSWRVAADSLVDIATTMSRST